MTTPTVEAGCEIVKTYQWGGAWSYRGMRAVCEKCGWRSDISTRVVVIRLATAHELKSHQ